MKIFLLVVVLLGFLAVSFALGSDEVNTLEKVSISQSKAKSLVRVRRGWGWGKKEERRESSERSRERDERAAEVRRRNERNREYSVWLDRTCPTICWNPWPSTWEGCSQPCGGGGVQWQTRTVKTGGALGRCQGWVGSRGCPGPNRRSRACNRTCPRGTPNPNGCTCPAGWTDQCCDRRITCSNPGSPSNGAVSASADSLDYGSTVSFSCNTGYNLIGSATAVCSGSGTWSNSVPTCNIVSCGNPGTPANATLYGSSFTYGSSVNVTCDYGYRLLGDSVRQCEATGLWSGLAPSCELIECPAQPAPENGAVDYPTGRNLDDELVYSCNTGFVLEGARTRQCQFDSEWTPGVATCTQILCDNLPAPANGQVTYSGSVDDKTKYGEMATFSCDQLYALQGSETLTCVGDTAVGNFDGEAPICIHYKDLQYECATSNPCKPLRVPHRYYYRHTEANKFVQCGAGGTCYEKTCPPPLLWGNDFLTCAWKWQVDSR